MSLLYTSRSLQEIFQVVSVKRPWLRPLLLCVLLLLAVSINSVLRVTAPAPDTAITPFMQLWMISFLPYFSACALVLTTRARTGVWQAVELAVLLVGALLLRVLLLSVPPVLSHDSWRYLWDARVTLHGYSPYVYAPSDPRFLALRDFIYDNSRFRNVPTVYPPGAQAIYIVSYLIAPSNLFVLKGLFVGCDLVTCAALILLLRRRGLDLSRCIIYAWCPLPIVEFAIQGHVDALTVTFTVLAILCAYGTWRGARSMTGFLLAVATLTKFYPALFLLAVVRRRDYALLLAFCATIAVSYIPYFILGHGQVLGFLGTYASEGSYNGGIIPLFMDFTAIPLGVNKTVVLAVEYFLDLVAVGMVAFAVVWLRRQRRVSVEAVTLVLIGTVFSVSSHIFPWYTTALLPWVAVLIGPLWTREHGDRKYITSTLAVAMAWYFACASITSYFYSTDWIIYYISVYSVVLVGLGIAGFVAFRRMKKTGS
ncbi:MAG: DUF2029 domain-containing protein [Ktedonobacteraceae bacterium]|nr:DUF2029 domain-containing protein [Ktedonobacteraceae bacterium]